MKRIVLATLAGALLAAGAANAASIGVGPFGGMNFPVLQEDTGSGPLFGIRVPVKLVPLVTVEPFYASSNLGDKDFTTGGITVTREGFDETAFGANVMLTFGGPFQFYPYAGLGSTKLKRTGADDTFTSYDFGLGFGLSPIPKLSVHVRGGLDAVVDGQASRKFATATVGASWALISLP